MQMILLDTQVVVTASLAQDKAKLGYVETGANLISGLQQILRAFKHQVRGMMVRKWRRDIKVVLMGVGPGRIWKKMDDLVLFLHMFLESVFLHLV
jgi:hypothetical protein